MKTTLEQMAQPYLIRVIEEDKQAIADHINKIWDQKKQTFFLDGFRKGKVPQDIAEKTEGFTNLYQSYLNDLIEQGLSKAGEENKVEITEVQQVIPERIGKDLIVMQVVAYLRPQVVSLDYSDVETEKLDDVATDHEVNSQLEIYQQQNVLLSPIEHRGVEFGDIVTISFAGSLDGVPLKEATAPSYTTPKPLAVGDFISDFETNLLGLEVGKSVTFNATFPDDYQAEHLRSKTIEFNLSVKNLQKQNVPDLTEIAEILNVDSEQGLRDQVSTEISKKKAENNKGRIETAICLELVRRAEVSPIPHSMIERRLTSLLQQQATNVNMTVEKYLEARKIEKVEFDNQNHAVATRDIKIQLILDYIANDQDLQPTEQEKTEYIVEEAARLRITEDYSKQQQEKQKYSQLKMKKAYDYLVNNVKYVDPDGKK